MSKRVYEEKGGILPKRRKGRRVSTNGKRGREWGVIEH